LVGRLGRHARERVIRVVRGASLSRQGLGQHELCQPRRERTFLLKAGNGTERLRQRRQGQPERERGREDDRPSGGFSLEVQRPAMRLAFWHQVKTLITGNLSEGRPSSRAVEA